MRIVEELHLLMDQEEIPLGTGAGGASIPIEAKCDSCSQCTYREAMLVEIMEGGHAFPGLEYWCRGEGSPHFNQRVPDSNAVACESFAATTRGSNEPYSYS